MNRRTGSGFTLIELIVVLAIVGLLISIAVPRFVGGVDRSREAVLRQNLSAMRSAIDQYRADTGTSPASLDDLVSRRYLREVPLDPITDARTTWVVVEPPADSSAAGGVYDVRSGAPGKAYDGSVYSEW